MNLPYIFGKPNNSNEFFLKRYIDKSKFDYNKIKNLFFFPSKRWDIETKNGILIKLTKRKLKDILN